MCAVTVKSRTDPRQDPRHLVVRSDEDVVGELRYAVEERFHRRQVSESRRATAGFIVIVSLFVRIRRDQLDVCFRKHVGIEPAPCHHTSQHPTRVIV